MSDHSSSSFLQSSKTKLLLVVITLVVLCGAGLGAAYFPSASNQGYSPQQPIPFSHKIHAGSLKMDCKYCHLGVEKSRHHTVPPVGVCMNCHTVVRADRPWIKKLQDHYKSGEPVEWVRVHELPDFVFFNHKPHVKAGMACETCHGNVKEMDVLFQKSPLTMGWCLDCHRGVTTPKDIALKKYPDAKSYEETHGKLMAPINCSTCHY